MPSHVCMGASLQCSFGAAPSSLVVVRPNRIVGGATPGANIQDNKPMANVPPFGVCSSLMNPTVASATAAALGVLTPMPCTPVTTAPWIPLLPTVMLDNQPVLLQGSILMCSYMGVIQITNAGQTTVDVAPSGGAAAITPPDPAAMQAEAEAKQEEEKAKMEEELEAKKEKYAAMSDEELEEAIASGELTGADAKLAQAEYDSR